MTKGSETSKKDREGRKGSLNLININLVDIRKDVLRRNIAANLKSLREY